MSFLAIKNQVADAFSGLLTNLGLTQEEAANVYLEDFNDLGSDPNRMFAKSGGYGFKVVGGSSKISGHSFDLQINPQTFQQDEDFSIQFFPTPKGITVEHQGSIMKDIVLNGVTGVHPKRGMGGIDKNGNIIFGKGNSGYKEFHDLRNFIRSYAEHKKNPSNGDMNLHFYNFKDQEFFIVECTRFSLKKDKSRPMMYEYTIVLKTIDRTTSQTEDASAFDQILGGIDDAFESVANVISVGRGVINGSLELLTSIDRDIRSKILDPLDELELAIQDFQNGLTTVLDLPRKFMKDLKSQLRDIGDKLANKSGIDTTAYNAYSGGSSAFSPEVPREPTYEDRTVLNTFKKLEQSIERIAFNNDYFFEKNNDVNSTKSLQILVGDTIQDIAARELGSADQFEEVIKLNNLKYPYIAEDAGDGVLSYDDKILIPQESLEDNSIKGIYRNIDYQITRNLPEPEKALGVDIGLDSKQDLAITNTGDLDLIAGVETVLQMIGIRLGVEKSSYKLHTKFGVALNIGEKNTFRATTLKSEILQQLLEDSRVEKGTRVYVTIDGNSVLINIFAKIKSTGQVIPLQLVEA